MFPLKFQVLGATALAGVILLQPVPLGSERGSRGKLPPDSVVKAVAARNPFLLNLCLAEGSEVNVSDAEGRTPLLLATLQRDKDVIQRLLKLGADVDAADCSGRTPLMIAATQGDFDLIEAFLERSSRPEGTDSDGRTAAHHALRARQYGCFQLLAPYLPELKGTVEDADLLALACESGQARVIKAVLDCYPDSLEWTACTRGALRVALASQDLELTRLLLNKHTAPPTVEGRTVPLLAQAIVDDDAVAFRALLAAGADVNTTLPTPADKEFVAQLPTEYMRGYVNADKDVTLLMLAAGLGRNEHVRALLDAGADKNRHTARYKMLALYFAARTKEAKCVQMLLGRGPTREELRVEISLATQLALVIKDGVEILKTAVSTGRKGFDTPAGEYVITDKKRSHRSSLYHVQMPYFMRLNCLDFGMHAGNVPNYPASHGCIRLPADAAEKIFAEIPVGTMVTIN